MKSLLTNLFRKKEDSNWSEYIQFKEPIQVKNSSYRYSWVRISKQTNGFYTLVGYDSSHESSMTMGAQSRGINIESFDKNEFERIRKLGKIKRFQLNNTTSIYVAIISLVFSAIFAFCGLILTVIINHDKIADFYHTYFNKSVIKQEKIVNLKTKNN